MNLKNNFYLMLLIIILSGLVIGKTTGDLILSSTLKGNITVLSFVFSPAQNFIETYSLLNNSNDYRRLTGYYAYDESGMVDINFLIERYKNEDSDIIKKTIIWVAERNIRKEKLVDFYRKLYNISPVNIQKILNEKITNSGNNK